ncbi:SixA phosphatase family protein [Granulicoccus sp. GXG6511]|uniref:SixA phosphatase family protein n=1 Tax=Granulicoccus sp. GXG6511 TaxID=3381351 RepID=UPI003D7ECCDE
MAADPRLLLLMRHADAVTFAPGLGDVDRPLSDHGEQQARRAGAYLVENDLTPDAALCSAAVRTRQTAGLLGLSCAVRHEEALYNAGSDTIREIIGTVDEDVRVLLVVGHAPGVPTLAHALADEARSDPQAFTAIRWGFPTATLVGLEMGGTWAEPEPGPVLFTFQG